MRPGATVERFQIPAGSGRWVERRRNLHSRTVKDAEDIIRALGDGWLLHGPWRLLDDQDVVVAEAGCQA